MKFCKALQKVAEASDPSYRPYWTNYKKLKKLIKAIVADMGRGEGKLPAARSVHPSLISFLNQKKREGEGLASAENEQKQSAEGRGLRDVKAQLQANPGEVAFFQLLHAELGKASDFFGKAEQQCAIREEFVRVGSEVLKRPPAVTVKDRWSVLSKAVFMLYKDLLLLETFAIMTFFAFSKILKKHDKVTGLETRGAFMINLVNKANFTNYPKILGMIERCQILYNDASQRLLQGMSEDERLFLYMVGHMGRSRSTSTGNNQQQQQQQQQQPDPEDRKRPAHSRAASAFSARRNVRLPMVRRDARGEEAKENDDDGEGDRRRREQQPASPIRPEKKRRVRFPTDEKR